MSAEDPGWPLPKTAATNPPMITGRTLIINGPNLADELRTTGGLGISSCVVDDLVFTIGTANVDIKETVDGRNLTDYAAVHVANYPRPTASVITALLDYLRRHNVKAINMDGIGAPTRLLQSMRLALAGFSVPRTVYIGHDRLRDEYQGLADQLDLPFILKALSATGGRYHYLVRSEDDFRQAWRTAERSGVTLLAQEFVPNDATYRLLVMGQDIPVVMRRAWGPGTHLTSIEHSGPTSLVSPATLPPTALQLARTAAALFQYDLAGVTLAQRWAAESWCILSVDANPALTTGEFVQEKIDAYRGFLNRTIAVDGRPAGHA